LERLPVKVNKPQGTATLELWVLYQQLKLDAGKEHIALNNNCTAVQLPKHTAQPHSLLSHHYASQGCNAEQLVQDQAKTIRSMPAAIFPHAAAQSEQNGAGSFSQEAVQVSHNVPGHEQEVH